MTSNEGFAAVAEWIALDADNETFIFRKFDKLAARRLLYMQARIITLEKQLELLDKEVVESKDMSLKDAAKTWEQLMAHAAEGHEQGRRMLQLLNEIDEALEKFYQALILQSQLLSLPRPNQRALDAFRHWLSKPFPILGGQSKHFLNDKNDLVTLRRHRDLDYLSELLRQYWPTENHPTRDGRLQIGRFNEKSISIAVNVISILVAAILLLGSITGLYFVRSSAAKLTLIGGFTALFALCVGLMTSARRAELFAATAAYAAVLVVFVSSSELSGG